MDHSPLTLQPNQIYRGIAAEDIAKDSTVLKVIIPEIMPNAPVGTLGAGITDETISLTSRSGKVINSTVTSANHIVATWAGSGDGNRRVPPLIRKGEPVRVERVEGQDKYTWKATSSGRDLRSTDRVHIEVAAVNSKTPGVTKDDTNTYSMYLDSEDKKVGMKTSKANGEVAAFSMEADLAAGTFHLSDDSEGVGNRIFLDTGASSGTPVLQLNLSTGVTLKMEGKNLFFKVPGDLLGDVGGRTVINSPLIVVNKSKAGVIIVNAASIVLNAAKDIIFEAGRVIGLNAAGVKVGGFLVAAGARIAAATKGPAGGDYKGATINDPLKSQVSEPGNSPDTTPSPNIYRSAT